MTIDLLQLGITGRFDGFSSSLASDTQMRIHQALFENPHFLQFLETLKNDPRVQNLEGKMISRGNSKSSFSVHGLAIWYISLQNNYGEEYA